MSDSLLIATLTTLTNSVNDLTGQVSAVRQDTVNIKNTLDTHVQWEEEQRKHFDSLKEKVDGHSFLVKAASVAAATLGAVGMWIADKALAYVRHS